MTNTNTMLPATSAWAPVSGVRERFGCAPISPLQGTGLPYGSAAKHAAPATQLGAVRTDDARVPQPRGRQR